MKHDEFKVRWNDGTYDRSRTCDMCISHDCHIPVHTDIYKEIGEDPLSYWEWTHSKNPFGGELNYFGEFIANEHFNANPDGLEGEEEARNSGISADKQELIEDAYQSLSTEQKQVWDLVMREQVSQVEAARRLGVTQPSVAKRLSNAKARFTNYLRAHTEDAN